MKKILLILFLAITFNCFADDTVSVKYIDDDIENIIVDFPSTICFYNAKKQDSKFITIKVEDVLDKEIIKDDVSFKIKGNVLNIVLDSYHPFDSTKFNDPNKIKIYIPIQFIDKTGTKYISFKKNDNGISK